MVGPLKEKLPPKQKAASYKTAEQFTTLFSPSPSYAHNNQSFKAEIAGPKRTQQDRVSDQTLAPPDPSLTSTLFLDLGSLLPFILVQKLQIALSLADSLLTREQRHGHITMIFV